MNVEVLRETGTIAGREVVVTVERTWDGADVLVDGERVGRVRREPWRRRYEAQAASGVRVGQPQRTRRAAVADVLEHHERRVYDRADALRRRGRP